MAKYLRLGKDYCMLGLQLRWREMWLPVGTKLEQHYMAPRFNIHLTMTALAPTINHCKQNVQSIAQNYCSAH
jgi:hypothetical protein